MRRVTKEMEDMLKSVGNVSIEEEDNAIDDDDNMPTAVYRFPGEDEMEEYEEEDPGDVRRPGKRPRRNVRKPKKYTR